MRSKRHILAAATLATLCGAAHARINITLVSGTGTVDQQSLVSGKWRIQLTSTDNGSPTQWLIEATSANEKIEYVRVFNNSSAGQTASVRIEAGTGNFDSIDEVSRINNTRVMVISTLETTGNVGILSTTNLASSDIGGDCLGPVTAVERGDAVASAITNLRVLGDLLGNVTAQYGYIEKIDVDGDIGSSGTPVNVYARDNIREIIADGSIYAAIDANQYNLTGDIGRVVSNGGVVAGSIECDQFTTYTGVTDPGIFVPFGDLSADVTLQSAMNRKIRIGGTFDSGATINLPSSGLTGQIVFNATNTTGDWDGEIYLNSVQLTSEPEYTNTAASVGGGSAGVARFTIHDTSCAPVNGATTTGYGIDPESIVEDPPCTYYFKKATLRFYGPVTPTNTSGTDCDVTVELNTGSGYTDITSSFKTLPVGSTGDRVIRVERDDAAGWALGTYRITRNGTRLTCQDVDGSPAVRDFTYILTLVDNCEIDSLMAFDLNNDNSIDPEDAVAWALSPSDVNRDSSTNETDLELLLTVIGSY